MNIPSTYTRLAMRNFGRRVMLILRLLEEIINL